VRGIISAPGKNAVRPGIAAVSGALMDGSLKVLASACPNLLAEAGLYRYGDKTTDSLAEAPLSEHNHALDALRYLVMGAANKRAGRY